MIELRVLFITAEPADQVRPAILAQLQAIQEAMHSDSVRFTRETIYKANRERIMNALQQFRPDIVHFLGHGDDDGLMIEGRDGTSAVVTLTWLVDVFSKYRSARLVLLNACKSATIARSLVESQSTAIQQVIGWTDTVLDEVVGDFATSFYKRRGEGQSILEAFDHARLVVGLETSQVIIAQRPPPPKLEDSPDDDPPYEPRNLWLRVKNVLMAPLTAPTFVVLTALVGFLIYVRPPIGGPGPEQRPSMPQHAHASEPKPEPEPEPKPKPKPEEATTEADTTHAVGPSNAEDKNVTDVDDKPKKEAKESGSGGAKVDSGRPPPYKHIGPVSADIAISITQDLATSVKIKDDSLEYDGKKLPEKDKAVIMRTINEGRKKLVDIFSKCEGNSEEKATCAGEAFRFEVDLMRMNVDKSGEVIKLEGATSCINKELTGKPLPGFEKYPGTWVLQFEYRVALIDGRTGTPCKETPKSQSQNPA